MKRFVPIRREEGVELIQLLAGKSLDEVVGILGSPTRERDASEFWRRSGGPPIETTRYSRVLEYTDVRPSIRTFFVLVRADDDKLEFELRGPELAQPQS